MSRKADYERYLMSEHWRTLRHTKYGIVGRLCQLCGDCNSIECHHVRYRQLTDCTPDDLIAICQGCHQCLHIAIRKQRLRVEDCELPKCRELVQWFKDSGLYQKRAERLAIRFKKRGKKLVKYSHPRCTEQEKKAVRKAFKAWGGSGYRYDKMPEFIRFLNQLIPNTAPPPHPAPNNYARFQPTEMEPF